MHRHAFALVLAVVLTSCSLDGLESVEADPRADPIARLEALQGEDAGPVTVLAGSQHGTAVETTSGWAVGVWQTDELRCVGTADIPPPDAPGFRTDSGRGEATCFPREPLPGQIRQLDVHGLEDIGLWEIPADVTVVGIEYHDGTMTSELPRVVAGSKFVMVRHADAVSGLHPLEPHR